jgi:hypothetical protein
MPIGNITRRRVWAAAAVVALLLAGCTAGATEPPITPQPTAPLPTPQPTTPPPATASAPIPTPAGSASPTASQADSDDELEIGAGASFAPNATGILPPAIDTGAAERLPGEPDSELTPGALNPAVTQATIHSTICVSGWTATIRPSSSYTTALKIKQIVQYGYSDTRTSSYEEDHLISLELGGAPADPRNLWPEPYTVALGDGQSTGAHTKDALETKLKSEVCAGAITLALAQNEIGDHWVHAYYGIALAGSPTGPISTAQPTADLTFEPTAVPAAGATAPPVPSVGTSPPRTLSVKFVSLPDPAPLGGVAHLEAATSAGATCGVAVTWPSGNKSTAGGLKTAPIAGDDGIVSWDWNVASTTRPGTAKTTVTCTLNGVSAKASAGFPVG